MRSFFLATMLAFSSSLLAKEDLTATSIYIQLKDPKYHDGTMTTHEGGVISGDNLRLQAQHITYTHKKHHDHIEEFVLAEEDLVLDYHGQLFVADSCEYDFITHEGVLHNVRFSVEGWMIQSKKILLHQDKSLEVFEASITTSDNNRIVWEMVAKYFVLTHDQYLSTKSMTFKAFNVPIFWIPGFKANLKAFADHPVHYSLTWDSGQDPKISMRYRAYAYQDFNVYLRADYRYSKGFGGAIEMDYKSDDKKTVFQSRNYLANDTFYNDDNPDKKMKRYRIQGLYTTSNKDNTGQMLLSYDKISDKNMPGDFRSDDFELNTAKRTHLLARYFHTNYLAGFNLEPRINPFQGFKQDLPDFKLDIKPLKLGPSGFILENRFRVGYLDYVYSNDLKFAPLIAQAVLQDFHAIKAETEQNLYYPLHFHGVHFSPFGGFKGIIYSNSPEDVAARQTVFTYGATLNAPLHRAYLSHLHTLTPYAHFKGYSKPSKNADEVFIFSLDDGLHRLNLLRFGLKNEFNAFNDPFTPWLTIDPYALMFLGHTPYHVAIPKAGIEIQSYLKNLFLYAHARWNFNNQLLDIGNIMLGYTFSQELACKLEYRHRSKYDFRKDQHDNYILDVTRSLDELVNSPLSDNRNVFLAKAELKLTPTSTVNLQAHMGWGRKNEPGYTEAKVDFLFLLSSAWRLKISYMHTTRGTNHVGLGLDLIK